MQINFLIYAVEIPELHVPRLDPFVWKKQVTLRTRNPSAPINIVIRNTNSTFYGLRNAEVIEVKGFGPDPRNSKFELTMRIPYMISTSKYKSTMNLFSLPIMTEGFSNTTISNPAAAALFL